MPDDSTQKQSDLSNEDRLREVHVDAPRHMDYEIIDSLDSLDSEINAAPTPAQSIQDQSTEKGEMIFIYKII